jgi:hypothetical protein
MNSTINNPVSAIDSRATEFVTKHGAGADIGSMVWAASVEDRLPTEDGEYLVAIGSPSWSEPLYDKAEFRNGEFVRAASYIAWMPIPPYKQEQV